MTDVLLTTYPNNWAKDSGGIINEGTYIAKNTVTGCRLSVSVGSLEVLYVAGRPANVIELQ